MKMRKMLFALLGAASLAGAVPLTAFAAKEVTSVTVDICPDLSSLKPGEMADPAEPSVTSGKAFVAGYSIESGERKKLKSYTYDITLTPEDGYEFASGLDVKAKGASNVLIRGREGDSLEVRLTTYPFVRLKNPSDVKETSDGYKWQKVTDAGKYNVIVYYTGENGKERKKTSTVNTTSIKLGKSFMENNGIEGISVQAIGGTSDVAHKFLLPSDWIMEDDETDPAQGEYYAKYSWPQASKDKPAKASGSSSKSSKSKSASTGAGPGTGPSDGRDTGWIVSPQGTWFRNPDGSWPANQWVLIKDVWYFFDERGYLVTNRWIDWNGAWYMVDPEGKMYANCTTPDGYYVDASGKWVP